MTVEEYQSSAGNEGPEPVQRPSFTFIVVMGVSGTGKSTLGSALARTLNMPYIEGDDLHPKANVDKMSSGQPLDDADREPWLELIRTTAEQKAVELHVPIEENAQARERCRGVVVTCSALKRYYRDILRGTRKPTSKESERLPQHLHLQPPRAEVLPTYFVFIHGGREVLLERMQKRAGHFMKASMLDSQLNTLEDPRDEEGVVVVSAIDDTARQLELALEGLMKIAGPYFKE